MFYLNCQNDFMTALNLFLKAFRSHFMAKLLFNFFKEIYVVRHKLREVKHFYNI